VPIRKRPALVLPHGFREQQLINRQSSVGMLTLSPARVRELLLAEPSFADLGSIAAVNGPYASSRNTRPI
jgi:hypothetical protein